MEKNDEFEIVTRSLELHGSVTIWTFAMGGRSSQELRVRAGDLVRAISKKTWLTNFRTPNMCGVVRFGRHEIEQLTATAKERFAKDPEGVAAKAHHASIMRGMMES